MRTRRNRASTFFPAAPAQQALARAALAVDGDVSHLAEVLRLDRGTLYRLMRKARLRYDSADAIAVALGRHPVELWPDWYDREPATGVLP